MTTMVGSRGVWLLGTTIAFLSVTSSFAFGGFHHGGGAQFHHRQQRRRPQQAQVVPEEDLDLYGALGLEDEASVGDVKKAYRKLSREFHPDRNSDPGATERFQEISTAYEILMDEEKKFLYDMGGMEMLRQGIQDDPMDMMQGFFGGHQGGTKRGPDAQMGVSVTLEDFYNGGEKTTKINRRVVCKGCSDKNKRKTAKCKSCGRCPNEVRMVHRQMGGGFIVQQQEEVPSTEKCKKEEKELNFVIERGMTDGNEIRFKYMSEQKPKQIPGDVVLKLQQKKHKIFERKGDTLHHTMKISLKESLIGFEKTITHLDGHIVEVERDGVTKPFETVVYQNEGMPIHEVPSQYGDLHITFEVVYPHTLPEDTIDSIRNIL